MKAGEMKLSSRIEFRLLLGLSALLLRRRRLRPIAVFQPMLAEPVGVTVRS